MLNRSESNFRLQFKTLKDYNSKLGEWTIAE